MQDYSWQRWNGDYAASEIAGSENASFGVIYGLRLEFSAGKIVLQLAEGNGNIPSAARSALQNALKDAFPRAYIEPINRTLTQIDGWKTDTDARAFRVTIPSRDEDAVRDLLQGVDKLKSQQLQYRPFPLFPKIGTSAFGGLSLVSRVFEQALDHGTIPPEFFLEQGWERKGYMPNDFKKELKNQKARIAVERSDPYEADLATEDYAAEQKPQLYYDEHGFLRDPTLGELLKGGDDDSLLDSMGGEPDNKKR